MKKLYSLILFCMVSMAVVSQPVARQKVILEIGTGTWCQYCPGAAMGADDLIENGCQVGVIEYHNGDIFANDASNYRNNYYAVSGYPTAHFDGIIQSVGGSNTESNYPTYLPLYQERMAIQSDFVIDIYGQNTGSTYYVQLVITKVNGSWGELTAHLALTESEIVYSWQGQSHLNFVERLMAPDHFGTTVDFTDEDEIVVLLEFEMDPSWVTNNCELVAFIQDEDTKEILQGNMVAVPDLEVIPAYALFESNTTEPCITTTVEFEDLSLGNVISWNWTFEGGTPATSSAQNPVVTYNTQGQYDVQLIAFDGIVYDTLIDPEYILVITPPVQPPVPAGPTSICQDDTGIQYTSQLVQFATTYQWTVDPPEAGTISGPDPVATFTPGFGYIGNYTIKVRADNNCDDGTWSEGLNCTTYMTPTQYTISDGSGYCEGGEGVELTMDGSQSGVNYEVFLDGESTGQIVAGTGSPISFGYKTEKGIYTCAAFTDHCDAGMVGNAYIFIIYPPEEAEKPAGPTVQCNNIDDATYTTEEIAGATSYTWTLTPSSAGVITGNTTTATVNWDNDYTGTAQISVAAVNSCFTGPASDNLSVTVNESPEPLVSGDQEVCDWEAGVIYNTPATEGNTYTWEINNGEITAGAGTHEILVTWHAPGTGWVKVTEANSNCSVTTSNYAVVVDDCVGIGEEGMASFSIYPNPVREELVIRFEGKNTDCRMMIVNQLGQVVLDQMTGGSKQMNINTSEYALGVYAVRIFNDDRVVEKKFVKVD